MAYRKCLDCGLTLDLNNDDDDYHWDRCTGRPVIGPFIRGLFGAPPGWSFVEADFGQIEFRLAVCMDSMLAPVELEDDG